MALRIGKKNNADDWSEASLQQELAQISGQEDEDNDILPSQSVATDDLLSDLDSPALETPGVGEVANSSRPKISPILLAGGLVFLFVAIGAGVWMAFFNSPAEDTSDFTPPIARRPAPSVKPAAPPAATKVLTSKPTKPAVKPNIKPAPGAKAATPPKPAKAPVAKKPQQAPPVAAPKVAPTPAVQPPGMAGVPGKGSPETTSVQVVGSPSMRSSNANPQLKALWKQGADAKHRGDYAGARRAWTKILQQRPGHPGIQEALDKLPQ